MSGEHHGLQGDHSDIDGESSSESVRSVDTAASSAHSDDPATCSESDHFTGSIQSHASDFKFTDAGLWKLHSGH